MNETSLASGACNPKFEAWSTGKQVYELFLDLQLRCRCTPLGLLRCLSFLKSCENVGKAVSPVLIGGALSLALKVVDLRSDTARIEAEIRFLISGRVFSPPNASNQTEDDRRLFEAEKEILRQIDYRLFLKDSSYYCLMLPSTRDSHKIALLVVHAIIDLNLDSGRDVVIAAVNVHNRVSGISQKAPRAVSGAMRNQPHVIELPNFGGPPINERWLATVSQGLLPFALDKIRQELAL